MDSPNAARTFEQALELLLTAATALREERSTDRFPRAKIAKLIDQARARLLTTAQPGNQGFALDILACNELLDDALRLAATRSEASSYQVQAMSAIERSQAILYYLAFRNEPETPIAKPLSMRPRSLRPPSGYPDGTPHSEPAVSLEACSADELDALLRRPNTDERQGSGGPEIELRQPESESPELEVRSLEPGELEDDAHPPERPHLWLRTDVTFDGPSNFYLGFEDDIAKGGLFLSTYNRQKVGTPVGLSVTLPSGYVVLTRGSVHWVYDPDDDSSPGFGVRFDALSADDRKAINDFIRIRAPMFYDDEP